MKKTWVQLLAVGILGIIIGRSLPGGRGNARDRPVDEITREVRRSTKVAQRAESERNAEFQQLRREASNATPDQIPAIVSRVMEIADPFQRRASLMEVLKYADATNGVEIMKGFIKVTVETGRKHDSEWKDACVEVGRRGGAEMMNQWKAKGLGGGNEEFWSGIYGMALDDPKGAMAWIQSPENQDIEGWERLITAVIAGATLSNPDEGIRMMAERPLEERKACIGQFTWNLIQNGGLESAIDWMLNVKKTSADTEPDYAAAVENDIFNRIIGAAEWNHGSAEMAGFLTRINASDPISPSRLLKALSPLHGTDAFDVIDHLSQVPGMGESDALDQSLQAVIARRVGDSPGQVEEWLRQHPSSPIAGRVRAGVAGSQSN